MIGFTVKTSGPVLEGKAPGVIRGALWESVRELVAEGERKVKLQLYPGHGLVTGHYRGSVHGETTDSLFGFEAPHGTVHDSGVVYGSWLEGVSHRNETTSFPGYAMFRNARQDLEKIKDNVVEKHVKKAAGKLG